MAIKAYVGDMGSGKTYEVVTVVILGALRRGRRVVANIAGLDYARMVDMLVAEGIDTSKIGELVAVSHEQVLQPLFWRTDKDAEEGTPSFIQPGDLLVLDEIWRFWEGFAAKGMPERVMNFVRMHRHFVHPDSGVSCDIALITQDVQDIGRKVKAVVEETYRMQKLTALGSSKRYRVDVFQKTKTYRKPQIQHFRTYDPKYFGLYKSHSQAKEGGAAPIEENIDGRGNILKGALFRVVLPIGALVFIASAWYVWRFFHPATQKPEPIAQQQHGESIKPKAPDVSADWHIVGHYSERGRIVFIVSDGQHVRALENPPAYKLAALSAETFFPEGQAVTTWSGKARKDKASSTTK